MPNARDSGGIVGPICDMVTDFVHLISGLVGEGEGKGWMCLSTKVDR